MLHRIHAAHHQATFSRGACSWLMIDDVPIERWLAAHLNDPQVEMLGLALIWLLDEDEEALAKRRFTPAEDGTSTVVPLLVCSDDMDFDCSVLVAEQVVEGDVLHWRRFGWSASGALEVGVSTYWNPDSQPVSFSLSAFGAALQDFETLLKQPVAQP